MHNNGLDVIPDKGYFFVTADIHDKGKFRTPTLRNVEFTAPYMHDGRFSTIDEVINHYSEGLQYSQTVDPLMKMVSQGGVQLSFEEKANLEKENIKSNKHYIVNKIGHALHDLDEKFIKFSKNDELDSIARAIGFEDPLLLQSMYIFKQPNIGGEVVCHQDSTFLYTEPESAVGFWVALEDANKDNGCLWVAPGGHKGPLRKLFTKIDNVMTLKTLDSTPFEETTTPLEVKKGSLVLLHGRLPHYSCENTSNKSRHAYTLHVIDGNCKYSSNNWLQRSSMPLQGFI